MVHRVVEAVDSGEVIASVVVNILPNDSLDDLENRVKSSRKRINGFMLFNIL